MLPRNSKPLKANLALVAVKVVVLSEIASVHLIPSFYIRQWNFMCSVRDALLHAPQINWTSTTNIWEDGLALFIIPSIHTNVLPFQPLLNYNLSLQKSKIYAPDFLFSFLLALSKSYCPFLLILLFVWSSPHSLEETCPHYIFHQRTSVIYNIQLQSNPQISPFRKPPPHQ